MGDGAYVRAVSLINEHRYQDALAALDRAQAAFGPHPDILTYSGYVWRKLGRLDEAERYYRAALAIAPSHRGATEYYGELKVIEGDMAGARALLARLDRQCAFGCAEAEDLRRWIDARRRPGLLNAPTARTLGLAALLLLAATRADAAVPLRAMRWIAAGADAARILTRASGGVPRRSDGAGGGVPGRDRPRGVPHPLLLGGQAARAGVACESCHRNGRTNPDFDFPGALRRAGHGRCHLLRVQHPPRRPHRRSQAHPRPRAGPRAQLKVDRRPRPRP